MTDNSTSSVDARDRRTYANLKNACIAHADLTGASISNADIRGAERGYAYWWARETEGPADA